MRALTRPGHHCKIQLLLPFPSGSAPFFLLLVRRFSHKNPQESELKRTIKNPSVFSIPKFSPLFTLFQPQTNQLPLQLYHITLQSILQASFITSLAAASRHIKSYFSKCRPPISAAPLHPPLPARNLGFLPTTSGSTTAVMSPVASVPARLGVSLSPLPSLISFSMSTVHSLISLILKR